MSQKRLVLTFGVIVVLLLVPLIAMQFTEEVRWDASDFVVATVLLSAAGIALEWVRSRVVHRTRRVAIVIAIVVVLLLLWAELAVGIFGTPFAGS